MHTYNIRTVTKDDIPFLIEMTIESAFVDETVKESWRKAEELPLFVRKFSERWGRDGDYGVVALSETGEAIGAGWYRLFLQSERGDGILAHPDVPELALAVLPAYRKQGIGTELMHALHTHARSDGFLELMLSVDPKNMPAIMLYKKLGYTVFETEDVARGTSAIMTVQL